jgi:hypothetical protein
VRSSGHGAGAAPRGPPRAPGVMPPLGESPRTLGQKVPTAAAVDLPWGWASRAEKAWGQGPRWRAPCVATRFPSGGRRALSPGGAGGGPAPTRSFSACPHGTVCHSKVMHPVQCGPLTGAVLRLTQWGLLSRRVSAAPPCCVRGCGVRGDGGRRVASPCGTWWCGDKCGECVLAWGCVRAQWCGRVAWVTHATACPLVCCEPLASPCTLPADLAPHACVRLRCQLPLAPVPRAFHTWREFQAPHWVGHSTVPVHHPSCSRREPHLSPSHSHCRARTEPPPFHLSNTWGYLLVVLIEDGSGCKTFVARSHWGQKRKSRAVRRFPHDPVPPCFTQCAVRVNSCPASYAHSST